MLRFKLLFIILLSVLMVAGSVAFLRAANDDFDTPSATQSKDDDEKVPLSDVPAKVLEAANKAVPGGEIKEVEKELEDDVVIYTVEKVIDGAVCKIEVTTDGVVKQVKKKGDEKAILSGAPSQVLEAVNRAVPGGEIEEVKKELEDGVVTYEVVKVVDGVEYEIKMTADGVVKEIKKDEEEDNEATKQEIYVDVNSTQESEIGTQDAPYKTIGKALENASKKRATKVYSVIYVQSGVYRENITISDRQFLIGDKVARPVIQAANPKKPTVTMQGNASIQFFKITGGDDGILVQAASRVTIEGNEVVKNDGDGIKFQKPKGTITTGAIAFIVENIISQNDDGIDLEDSIGLIQKNKIFNNRDDGVDYDGDAAVKTIENEITQNKDDGIEIRLYKNVSAHIEANQIMENGEDGIEIINTPLASGVKTPAYTNRVYIVKNTIRQNHRYGIGCVDVKTEDVKESFEDGVVFYFDNIVAENRRRQIAGIRLKEEDDEDEKERPRKFKSAKVWDFQKDQVGKIARGFRSLKTGKGKRGVWKVLADSENKVLAVAEPRILANSATVRGSKENPGYHFNLAVAEGRKYSDLQISVKFKAVKGVEDQGGGPIWRYQDANNYYIARANPLEDNFRVYKVVDGRRKQLASKKLKVTSGEWHTIGIVMQGKRIQCSYDGVPYLDVRDNTFKRGKIGLWTKADAVTYFDDLKVVALDGKKEPRKFTESKVETEEEYEKVALSQVPPKVLEAANKAVPGGEVKEVSKEVNGGDIIYEVEKVVDGVEYEIKVTEDGAVKKVEKEDEDEDDDD